MIKFITTYLFICLFFFITIQGIKNTKESEKPLEVRKTAIRPTRGEPPTRSKQKSYIKIELIYNLGQNKWNIWTTPPPHFNDAKMARFALRASSSLLRGGGGLIVPFYTVQDCNLGQNKWNIWTTPPPHFNDAKMARFALRASSSLLRGEGG